MPPVTVTCTNPECRASLKLPDAPPPGKKLRCPRCQTAFVPPAKAAPLGETDAIRLAPEAERSCPSCQAAMAPNAVLCIACGFDLRTGEKRETVKKTKKKSGRSKDEPVTEENLPGLLDEVEALTRLAQKALFGLPDFLGLGDDPRLLGAGNRPGRCANPNCQTNLDSGLIPTRRVGTSKVKVDLRDRIVQVELCEDCTEMLLSFLDNRDKTARSYLDEARLDLERARRQFPDNDGIERAFKEIGKVDKMIAEKKRKSRLCFVATAAFGSPTNEEVQTLRRFRDEVLERSALGRCFIRSYYRVSPPLANLIAGSPRGRAIVRWLLRPVVAGCRQRLASRERQRPQDATPPVADAPGSPR